MHVSCFKHPLQWWVHKQGNMFLVFSAGGGPGCCREIRDVVLRFFELVLLGAMREGYPDKFKLSWDNYEWEKVLGWRVEIILAQYIFGVCRCSRTNAEIWLRHGLTTLASRHMLNWCLSNVSSVPSRLQADHSPSLPHTDTRYLILIHLYFILTSSLTESGSIH